MWGPADTRLLAAQAPSFVPAAPAGQVRGYAQLVSLTMHIHARQ